MDICLSRTLNTLGYITGRKVSELECKFWMNWATDGILITIVLHEITWGQCR